ncbi:MAG: Clp1/GlmU family protein [Candidatus Bathyarchaeia archaeon]
MLHELSPKNTLLVRGPASIVLLDGQASILGAGIQSHQRTTVMDEKQLPIETAQHANLEIALGKSAEIFEVQGSTIPRSWSLAAEALAEMNRGKVAVIGPTDVGKSTLCVYLVNRLLGQKLSIVDADVGQTDFGPPTTIARAEPKNSITSLTELLPDARIFIGHTSPAQVKGKLIDGIQRLSAGAEDSLTIINTDGWITDPEAIQYKIDLIARIKPDLVIGLGFGNELQPILAGSRAQSMTVEPANEVLSRSKSDRRKIRVNGYRKFLDGGSMRTFTLREVQVSIPEKLSFLAKSKGSELRNLIVGLLDENRYLVQIGVLLTFEPGTVRVYCKPAEEIRTIELGYLKLSTNGNELGFVDR